MKCLGQINSHLAEQWLVNVINILTNKDVHFIENFLMSSSIFQSKLLITTVFVVCLSIFILLLITCETIIITSFCTHLPEQRANYKLKKYKKFNII